MVSDIKALPRNEGVSEIFLPGEIEQRRRAERKADGIPVEDVVYEELRELGRKYGVGFGL
jgi:LDH2 family malate/lactate/ureidoglycolate dehydrogenase